MNGPGSIPSTTTSSTNIGGIEQPETMRFEKPAKKLKQDTADNSVSDHGTSSQTNNSPTDGARDATANHPLTHGELERLTEERLMEDPEYRKLKEQLDLCGGLEDVLLQIDSVGIFSNDRKICWDDVQALVNDVHQPNTAAREAAKFLNDHKQIWAAICGDDNLVSLADVQKYLTGMKDQLKAMKDSARADIKAENGVGASSSPSAATGTGAAASTSQPTSSEGPGQLFKAPTLSTKPGMEGAVENIGNTLTAIGNATSDLAAQLANPDLKPEERQKLQARYNELQQLQSMLTAMYTQIQEAIANLMKMYSDVAKNSIQNMR